MDTKLIISTSILIINYYEQLLQKLLNEQIVLNIAKVVLLYIIFVKIMSFLRNIIFSQQVVKQVIISKKPNDNIIDMGQVCIVQSNNISGKSMCAIKLET